MDNWTMYGGLLAAGVFSDSGVSPLAWAQLIADREYLSLSP